MPSNNYQKDLRIIRECLTDRAIGDPDERPESRIGLRLFEVLRGLGRKAGDFELAILIRQFLNYVDYWQQQITEEFEIHGNLLTNFNDWHEVGIEIRTLGRKRFLSKLHWTPNWLPDFEQGVDFSVNSEQIVRDFTKNAASPDPFLKVFDYQNYRSIGQRSAIRSTLTTPPAEKLIINLPTGEGKSFVFQAIHKLGFTSSGVEQNEGLTLVVVPTISLGLDLERETAKICGITSPLFYESGNEVRRSAFLEQINSGQNSIIFSSPEAITSQFSVLKNALLRAAENGAIKAVVIDEAHLIESWGIDFRDDFQELGSFCDRLNKLAPRGREPRNIFLSATLSPSARETIERIFNNGNFLKCVSAGSLRSEPLFLQAQMCSEEEQKNRVLEALFHAPRPCIMYTSTRVDAKKWFEYVKLFGFERVGLVHGETSTENRKQVLKEWKEGELDLIVGTSAFGIGIDYKNVRTVIHACIPETLDRFYQEVGRGGRDGRRCLSLLIPKFQDAHTAEKLSNITLIGIERGYERWMQMFRSKKVLRDDRVFVNYAQAPGTDHDDIDMIGDFNSRWNLRVLNLLVRTNAIKILGPPDSKSFEELGIRGFLELEILDDSHNEFRFWQERVQTERRTLWAKSRSNFDLMMQFVNEGGCPSQYFLKLYGEENVQAKCGSCSICELSGRKKFISSYNLEPRVPWRINYDPFLDALFGRTKRSLLHLDISKLTPRLEDRLFNSMKRLGKFGINKILQIGAPIVNVEELKDIISDDLIFFETVHRLPWSKLHTGAEIVLVGEGAVVTEQDLNSDKNPRLYVMSEDILAPDGRRLLDVFQGRRLSPMKFIEEVNA